MVFILNRLILCVKFDQTVNCQKPLSLRLPLKNFNRKLIKVMQEFPMSPHSPFLALSVTSPFGFFDHADLLSSRKGENGPKLPFKTPIFNRI